MAFRKLAIFAAVMALAVFFIPWVLPTGPDAGLDAARFLEGGSFFFGAAVVFLGGLLTAMTPCVYPLIPITVSVFGARKAEGRGKAMLLTSAYVVGMGVVFAALGILAAKTGQAFGSMLGSPWVVGGLAVFLLALSASMFGAFELNLPTSLTTRLNSVGGSGLAGAFLMGSVSGFLAAPCTGPVLTGLLTFVAKSQSTALGGGLLFIYALGIGVPFFLIGVFTVRLPKGGAWMEGVKSVLGIVLVALAASYIRDASPALREAMKSVAAQFGELGGATVAAVLALVGVLLGAVHLSFKTTRREFAVKAFAVLMVVSALLLRGAALDAPRPGHLWVAMGIAEPAKAPEFKWDLKFAFASEEDTNASPFEQALAQAKAENKPVMIDFFAEWCAACKELDRYTYVAEPVIGEASRFVNIKVDATNDTEAIQALQERFGVQGLPTVAFISSEGKLLEDPKVTGFLEPEQFLTELKKVQ